MLMGLPCFSASVWWDLSDGAPGPMYAGSGKSTLLLALCFCFAVPLSQLGVKSLANLCSTDATKVQPDPLYYVRCCSHRHAYQHLGAETQVCGATVWIEDAQGKKRASHTVSANLKGDGSREYRIDNRVKSGKELKVGAE